ncbi:retrovirus-related pol polyprotein from transposon TNT 1-94, partial [Tanacetum coccineum]
MILNGSKECDIRKPIWYLYSGCSRHMTGVKSYLYKCEEQLGPKVVFGDDSTCTTEGYGSIKCNGMVFTKGKHHRASFKTKQTSSIKKCLHLLHMDLFRPVTPRSINHEKYTLVIIDEYSRNSTLVNFCDEKRISQNFSSPYTPEQNGVAERKNRTLIEAARTMLSGSVFFKEYWTKAVATACYTQNRSTIVKIHLKTPYEIFRKRIPNISFLHVFGCPVYIHNHKDHLRKFNEKANDGYLLRYSLVSKAFRVFNTRTQQTEETYHITFDESPKAIKFSKPSVDNINIAKSENIHLMNIFILMDLLKVSSDQNDQTYQPVQNDKILNDDHFEHFNHTNDEQIIDSLPNTKDIQISEHLSSPNTEDTSTQNTTIPSPPLHVPSMVTLTPLDK